MADKRRAIVEAALEVIGDSGPGGFTQPRVAARAGLRQSHLTYYFPTRDDLLAAVAEEAVRRRIAVLREAQAAAGGPGEQVAALAQVLTAPEHTRILLALTQAADRDAAVRASFDALAAGVGPLGADLLATVGAEPDPVDVALVQALSTGIAVLSLARGGDAAAAEHLLRAFLDRLAAARSHGDAGVVSSDAASRANPSSSGTRGT
ncbi:TetR/AcrR family transcriptional regulator [Actinomycetospora cinnamomea]|uniref:TetR family transcriptional regulator n=1 Tax=Actinomycetospora cinnamomea TaxID=663609 RepID=A0A2U1FPZ5_9PSEU|nr:TetR family transcriptional regulator [Actinomycetospora cinnamomea]PVZ14224.1 TetR family transcriptional regulator [Actinomycetospora cinnamomea]